MITSLLLLLSATVAHATNHVGIPAAFTRGFRESTKLQITYPSGELADGADLTGADTSAVPAFKLGDSSGINRNAQFIILMLDPDVNGDPEIVNPQRLHYLRSGFAPTGQGVNISSDTPPVVPYVGPEATTDANGIDTHRYVFLMYAQPKELTAIVGASADARDGFNVTRWREDNGLEPAVAGLHFTSKIGGGVEVDKPKPPGAVVTELVTVTAPCACTAAPPTPPVSCTSSASAPGGGVSLSVLPPSPSNTAPAAPPPPPRPAQTHTIIVGGTAGLVYTPSTLVASPGDIVRFDFHSVNHTATQSTFDAPCIPNASGVRSGFRPNAANIAGTQLFDFTVPDSKPQWFFCAQGNHCRQGMVFAVNPGSDAKFKEFRDRAMGGDGGNGTVGGISQPVPSGGLFTGAAGVVAASKAVVVLAAGVMAAIVTL